MTPHDIKGCTFQELDLVACGYLGRLLLGRVREINTNTGCVTVATVDLSREPIVKIEKFPFPSNQLVIIREEFNPNSPLYPILGDICPVIRLDGSGLCDKE